MQKCELIELHSRDYWFKVVDFLQQNWALIETGYGTNMCKVFFFNDASGVFDQLDFDGVSQARLELLSNGFCQYSVDDFANRNLAKPLPPFYECKHPNGRIYSSGLYWKRKVASSTTSRASKRQRSTVILKVGDAILLTETHGGKILLPGGAIGRRELPIAAAARELMEETGLVATTITFLFEHESVSTFHHVFFASAPGTPVARDDAARILYSGLKTNDTQLNMSPATRDIVRKFREI